MVIGQNKCGDVMKVVCKGAALAAVGLAAAIIVYPFTHELGHVIAAWLSGAQICEFHLFLYQMYFANLIPRMWHA